MYVSNATQKYKKIKPEKAYYIYMTNDPNKISDKTHTNSKDTHISSYPPVSLCLSVYLILSLFNPLVSHISLLPVSP